VELAAARKTAATASATSTLRNEFMRRKKTSNERATYVFHQSSISFLRAPHASTPSLDARLKFHCDPGVRDLVIAGTLPVRCDLAQRRAPASGSSHMGTGRSLLPRSRGVAATTPSASLVLRKSLHAGRRRAGQARRALRRSDAAPAQGRAVMDLAKKVKVLLVDDSTTVLIMEEALLRRKHDVLKATSGAAALKIAAEQAPRRHSARRRDAGIGRHRGVPASARAAGDPVHADHHGHQARRGGHRPGGARQRRDRLVTKPIDAHLLTRKIEHYLGREP